MTGKLFVISAPSGAGKTTLVSAIIARLNPTIPIERLITYTTRLPRIDEKDGIDYHFLTTSKFEIRMQHGYFLDWSSAYGAYYGAPLAVLNKLQQGISVVCIFDRAGVERLCEHSLISQHSFVPIWIDVPLQTLHMRLMKRNSETPEHIKRRLLLAQKEIESEQKRPLYRYHIVNDNFHHALVTLEEIICSELIIKRPIDRLAEHNTR